jgi:hypothetical protein
LKSKRFDSDKFLRDDSFFSKRRRLARRSLFRETERLKDGEEKETPRFRDVPSVRRRKTPSDANALRKLAAFEVVRALNVPSSNG